MGDFELNIFECFYNGKRYEIKQKCEIGNIECLFLTNNKIEIGYVKEFLTKPIYTTYAILGEK